MGIISDVKCGRCDRRYSGFRARCPYCGARRGKRGKHANNSDNSKGKLIIGLLLILVLIVAVIVLVVTSVNDKKAQEEAQTDDNQQTQIVPTDEDVTNVQGTGGDQNTNSDDTNADDTGTDDQNGDDTANTDDVTDSTDDTADTQTERVTSVTIKTDYGTVDEGFTVSVGDKLNLSYETTPEGAGKKAEWKSSNEDVFTVLQTGEFTALSKGTEYLTLTVDGITTTCLVVVN
jgi:predicted  nucleic acid-binding Zn-ribbon protein